MKALLSIYRAKENTIDGHEGKEEANRAEAGEGYCWAGEAENLIRKEKKPVDRWDSSERRGVGRVPSDVRSEVAIVTSGACQLWGSQASWSSRPSFFLPGKDNAPLSRG